MMEYEKENVELALCKLTDILGKTHESYQITLFKEFVSWFNL